MLELKDVVYRPATAETAVLQGIDLQVCGGQPLLISGASGSGKTSLLEVISGLSGQRRGQVLWNGSALNQRQRRWLCGVVFQFPERHFLGASVVGSSAVSPWRCSCCVNRRCSCSMNPPPASIGRCGRRCWRCSTAWPGIGCWWW